MIRRLHVPALRPGEIALDEGEAHHARDVLRLIPGTEVELFDDAGSIARGQITRLDRSGVWVLVQQVVTASDRSGITIASAVPKGDRADWMIEKLSELGVRRFIPLQTSRSVVAPAGKNKRERWMRLAVESAKQSRRTGVMQIDELTPLEAMMTDPVKIKHGVYLSTDESVKPLIRMLASEISNFESQLVLLIGPEGGWTDEELSLFQKHNLTPAKLTATILRVETAAIAAAAILAVWETHLKSESQL